MATPFLIGLLFATFTAQGVGAVSAPPGSLLERYEALLYLRDEGFRCESSNWSAQELARFRRLGSSLHREMDVVRDALIAREGRESVEALVERFEARWQNAEPPRGCSFRDMAIARRQLRSRLHALEFRLGIGQARAARMRD
jgi:hypothetical protein